MIRRRVRILRYGGTAGAAAVVDIGLFWLVHAAGLSIAVAAALSFLLATVVNYTLTARHVFQARISFRGYLRFLSAASLGFVVNVGTTMLLVQGAGLPALLAKCLGIGVAFFANFAMNALLVFRPEQDGTRSAPPPGPLP